MAKVSDNMLPVKISKSSIPDKVYHGHKTVGASIVQFDEVAPKLVFGLVLRTPGRDDPVTNSAPIWVGGSNVTADSDPGTGGFPLVPGASLSLSVEDAKHLYFISTVADQSIMWIGN